MRIIYNKISNIINNMLEKAGYHFVGYKVDIEQNISDIKAIKKYKVGLNKFYQDIEAIQLTIKSMREDYESLRTFHSNLAIEYRDNSASHTNLLKLKNELNARIDMIESKKSLLDTPFKDDEEVYDEKVNLNDLKDELTKPCKNNIDDNILMLENIINSIIEVKVNNACLLVQYGADIKLDKEPYQKYSMKEILEHYIKPSKPKTIHNLVGEENTLKKIAKVLVPYENKDYIKNIKTNKMLFDIIDDINDVFEGFTNIYHDEFNDDNNNINLTK